MTTQNGKQQTQAKQQANPKAQQPRPLRVGQFFGDALTGGQLERLEGVSLYPDGWYKVLHPDKHPEGLRNPQISNIHGQAVLSFETDGTHFDGCRVVVPVQNVQAWKFKNPPPVAKPAPQTKKEDKSNAEADAGKDR